ncbi:MAG: hypothetical protein HQK58_04010 [Deltaproteobacteria bacterium]|nr:hypothetical protein [Deltaproteobacteria bacterium]
MARAILIERHCQVCGTTFMARSYNQKYCDQKECQREKHRVWGEMRNRSHKKDRPPARSTGRLCRRCGKTITGPNYFYCVACHTYISQYGTAETD